MITQTPVLRDMYVSVVTVKYHYPVCPERNHQVKCSGTVPDFRTDQNTSTDTEFTEQPKSKNSIYKTIILSVVLYGCETWSLTLMKEDGLKILE
jgi:hypothetical protein